MITQERVKELFSYNVDTGEFYRKIDSGKRGKKGTLVGTDRHGYLTVKINGKRHSLHRLAWLYIYGEFPSGDLDHKNGNPTDNRINNLRIATKSQNLANSIGQPSRRKASKGIHWRENIRKWVAQINKDNTRFYLGVFKHRAEAEEAYALAAKKLYGEFARICCVILLLGVAGCAPTLSSVNPEGAKRIAQAAFKPITWSKRDTGQTIREVKIHNQVGIALGLWKYPPKRRAK